MENGFFRRFRRKNYSLPKNGMILFGIFYLCALCLAAMLTPALFYATKFLANKFSMELFQHFIDKGFGKFFGRAQLIALVILMFPFLKICGFHSLKDIYLTKIRGRKFLLTSSGGFILTCTIFAWLFLHNVSIFKPVIAKVCFWNLFKFTMGAIGIGFLEEIIFRGIIFNLFSRNLNAICSILLTSLFFAYCHLEVGNSLKIDMADVSIFSGFRCIIPTIMNIGHGFSPLNFLNLMAFGVLLSLLVLKNKSLLFPIAFHMGVVFALMSIRSFVDVVTLVDGKYCSIGILDTWISLALQSFVALGLVLWKCEKMQKV
ncbi:MAG: CPBP family intramembrane metalloprotease [Puniceicoccales bacterium]|jgi:membrane protease YdiL (CAAX protease family)|nr:CPBP family intramembrane metalloprotease [Puniceicoccales bacterium]